MVQGKDEQDGFVDHQSMASHTEVLLVEAIEVARQLVDDFRHQMQSGGDEGTVDWLWGEKESGASHFVKLVGAIAKLLELKEKYASAPSATGDAIESNFGEEDQAIIERFLARNKVLDKADE